MSVDIMGFGLIMGFIGYLQKVTTNSYDSLIESHASKATVTTAHINSSQSAMSSPAVAW
jgi:hypothetical protein